MEQHKGVVGDVNQKLSYKLTWITYLIEIASKLGLIRIEKSMTYLPRADTLVVTNDEDALTKRGLSLIYLKDHVHLAYVKYRFYLTIKL